MEQPNEPNTPRRNARASRLKRWLRQHQATLILVAILVVIVVTPLLDYWPNAHVLFAPMVALLILATIQYSRAGKKLFYFTLVLAAAWIVTLPIFGLTRGSVAPSCAVMLAMNAIMLSLVVRHVTSATKPDTETLSAALSGYLIIGSIWAQAYFLILSFDPGALSLPQGKANINTLMYFSLQTLTTLGFGDVAPVNPFVRMLAVVEAIIGQFYIATIIAQLATLAERRARR